MPVERDIDLNKPLSTEDINYLEEEANRLEELAKQAQEDAKKAKQFQKEEDKILSEAVNKVDKIEKEAEKAEKAKNKIGKSIKEVNELAEHQSGLAGMGGADTFSQQGGMGGMVPGAGQIKAGRTGFGTGQERSPLGLIPQEQRQREIERLADEKLAKEERDALTKAQKEAEEERRENAKAIAENKKIVSDIQKGANDVMGAMRNPAGFGMGRFKGALGKAGLYGLIALAVWQMAEQIFKEIQKLYAPGGPHDIRKQMLDRDREIAELDHIIARRAGQVFFTSDLELQQGAPEFSNTSRKRDRTSVFQAFHLGE